MPARLSVCDVWSAATEPEARERFLLDGTPTLRTGSCQRLVVVTAHLDEDVCAAGGLIGRLAERSVPIDVLAVTDGDGTRPGESGAESAHELGMRRAHRPVGYQRLGARGAVRHELALRSGTVEDRVPDVVAALSEIIGFDPDPTGLWVLAPWCHDGHSDHEAVGRAAATVCDAYRIRLVEYLVTGWTGPGLAALPRDRARQLPLTPLLRARKMRAIAASLRAGHDAPVADREVFLIGTCGDGRGRRSGHRST